MALLWRKFWDEDNERFLYDEVPSGDIDAVEAAKAMPDEEAEEAAPDPAKAEEQLRNEMTFLIDGLDEMLDGLNSFQYDVSDEGASGLDNSISIVTAAKGQLSDMLNSSRVDVEGEFNSFEESIDNLTAEVEAALDQEIFTLMQNRVDELQESISPYLGQGNFDDLATQLTGMKDSASAGKLPFNLLGDLASLESQIDYAITAAEAAPKKPAAEEAKEAPAEGEAAEGEAPAGEEAAEGEAEGEAPSESTEETAELSPHMKLRYEAANRLLESPKKPSSFNGGEVLSSGRREALHMTDTTNYKIEMRLEPLEGEGNVSLIMDYSGATFTQGFDNSDDFADLHPDIKLPEAGTTSTVTETTTLSRSKPEPFGGARRDRDLEISVAEDGKITVGVSNIRFQDSPIIRIPLYKTMADIKDPEDILYPPGYKKPEGQPDYDGTATEDGAKTPAEGVEEAEITSEELQAEFEGIEADYNEFLQEYKGREEELGQAMSEMPKFIKLGSPLSHQTIFATVLGAVKDKIAKGEPLDPDKLRKGMNALKDALSQMRSLTELEGAYENFKKNGAEYSADQTVDHFGNHFPPSYEKLAGARIAMNNLSIKPVKPYKSFNVRFKFDGTFNMDGEAHKLKLNVLIGKSVSWEDAVSKAIDKVIKKKDNISRRVEDKKKRMEEVGGRSTPAAETVTPRYEERAGAGEVPPEEIFPEIKDWGPDRIPGTQDDLGFPAEVEKPVETSTESEPISVEGLNFQIHPKYNNNEDLAKIKQVGVDIQEGIVAIKDEVSAIKEDLAKAKQAVSDAEEALAKAKQVEEEANAARKEADARFNENPESAELKDTANAVVAEYSAARDASSNANHTLEGLKREGLADILDRQAARLTESITKAEAYYEGFQKRAAEGSLGVEQHNVALGNVLLNVDYDFTKEDEAPIINAELYRPRGKDEGLA